MELGFNTPSHQNIEGSLLDVVPGIAWYTNRKLQSCLTVDNNRSYWGVYQFPQPVTTAVTTTKTCPCWIGDHRTFAINLSTFLSLALTPSVGGIVASLVIHVFGSVFAWEASRALATSREITPARDLLRFWLILV